MSEAALETEQAEAEPLDGDEPADAPPEEPTLEMLLMQQLPKKSLFAFLYRGWMDRNTSTGRAMLLALLICGTSAGGFGIQYPVYLFACFLLGFQLVARGAGFVFKPRGVEVERRLPERVAAGATVTVTARVTHAGRMPAFDLAVREQNDSPTLKQDDALEYRDVLTPGETAELTYRIQPTKRGSYDLKGPQVVTGFPFGIYNTGKNHSAPHRMLVYPRFAPLRSVTIPTGRKHQPGGLQLVSKLGDSEEFVGNREYRPGDRLRDIHHMAWARIGFPVVREYQQEYLTRIALVVDTFVPRSTPATTRCVEAAISLGAGVAEVLSRQEYVVDVFAAGPELYHFQAGRSLAYLDNILDVLACVEECRADPFPDLGPAVMAELEQISSAVVVFLDWDETRLGFVRAIQESGVETKVVVVRDKPTTIDPGGFVSAAGPIQLFTAAQVEEGVLQL